MKSSILGTVNTTTLIIVAVAVVLLLAVIAIVVGLQLRKKRRISLSRPEERKELTREERSHFVHWVALPCLGAALTTGFGFLMFGLLCWAGLWRSRRRFCCGR